MEEIHSNSTKPIGKNKQTDSYTQRLKTSCCLKSIIVIVIVFVLIYFGSAYLISTVLGDRKMAISVDNRIDITPAQIQKIQDIGQWEFLSISDEEIVDTVSKGFFSDSELVRIYYGTLRLGIDLHKAVPRWLHVEDDTVVVATLPAIQLLDKNFIDEARSRSFFESGTWKAADRDHLYNKVYKKMLKRCYTLENIKIAEENAKQQFGQFIRSMGYKHVRIEFQSKPK